MNANNWSKMVVIVSAMVAATAVAQDAVGPGVGAGCHRQCPRA